MSKGKVLHIPQKTPTAVSHDHVEVRKSPIHGRGVFAGQYFADGHRIGVVSGTIPKEINFTCPYSIWFKDGHGNMHVWTPDEPYRYLNHSETPNAAINGVTLYALEIIYPGDEITIYYGPGWDGETTEEDIGGKSTEARKRKKSTAKKKGLVAKRKPLGPMLPVEYQDDDGGDDKCL